MELGVLIKKSYTLKSKILKLCKEFDSGECSSYKYFLDRSRYINGELMLMIIQNPCKIQLTNLDKLRITGNEFRTQKGINYGEVVNRLSLNMKSLDPIHNWKLTPPRQSEEINIATSEELPKNKNIHSIDNKSHKKQAYPIKPWNSTSIPQPPIPKIQPVENKILTETNFPKEIIDNKTEEEIAAGIINNKIYASGENNYTRKAHIRMLHPEYDIIGNRSVNYDSPNKTNNHFYKRNEEDYPELSKIIRKNKLISRIKKSTKNKKFLYSSASNLNQILESQNYLLKNNNSTDFNDFLYKIGIEFKHLLILKEYFLNRQDYKGLINESEFQKIFESVIGTGYPEFTNRFIKELSVIEEGEGSKSYVSYEKLCNVLDLYLYNPSIIRNIRNDSSHFLHANSLDYGDHLSKHTPLPKILEEVNDINKQDIDVIFDYISCKIFEKYDKVTKAFRAMDLSVRGKINMQEFIYGVHNMNVRLKATIIGEIFTMLDLDGDGYLNLIEFSLLGKEKISELKKQEEAPKTASISKVQSLNSTITNSCRFQNNNQKNSSQIDDILSYNIIQLPEAKPKIKQPIKIKLLSRMSRKSCNLYKQEENKLFNIGQRGKSLDRLVNINQQNDLGLEKIRVEKQGNIDKLKAYKEIGGNKFRITNTINKDTKSFLLDGRKSQSKSKYPQINSKSNFQQMLGGLNEEERRTLFGAAPNVRAGNLRDYNMKGNSLYRASSQSFLTRSSRSIHTKSSNSLSIQRTQNRVRELFESLDSHPMSQL